MPAKRSLEDRLMEKVIPEPNSGCHLWLGAVRSGYGVIGSGVGKKVALAHRVSWGLANGPIPAGLCVLHRCDVPSCVNPDHLFLGTIKDNSLDMVAKRRDRNQNVDATHCIAGHEYAKAGFYVCRGANDVAGNPRTERKCKECVRLRNARRAKLGEFRAV